MNKYLIQLYKYEKTVRNFNKIPSLYTFNDLEEAINKFEEIKETLNNKYVNWLKIQLLEREEYSLIVKTIDNDNPLCINENEKECKIIEREIKSFKFNLIKEYEKGVKPPHILTPIII